MHKQCPYQDCRRGSHVRTGGDGASRHGGRLVLIRLGRCTDLHLALKLRLDVVVVYVTVRGRAGIIATKDPGIPWAVLDGVGGRRGFMAAGDPDGELFLRGSS